MFKQLALPIPATLVVCDCGLVVSLVERIKVFDTPINLREMFHISDIREVSKIIASLLREPTCNSSYVVSVCCVINSGAVLSFIKREVENVRKLAI